MYDVRFTIYAFRKLHFPLLRVARVSLLIYDIEQSTSRQILLLKLEINENFEWQFYIEDSLQNLNFYQIPK